MYRFKSENVESNSYLLTVIRYIHQNPVKAGIVKLPREWMWSSCQGYYGKNVYPEGLLDSEFILKIYSDNENIARDKFKEFNEMKLNDKCLDDNYNEPIRLSDGDARTEIKKNSMGTILDIGKDNGER
ncbi:MAG: hypothetical protein ACOYVD_13635 [Bacillota bacterium]